MLISQLCLDIIICISSNLYINNLSNFILQDKTVYANRYAILRNNPHIIKYLLFDDKPSYYYLVFKNDILSNNIHYDYHYNYYFNNKELYAITNIVSYYIVDNAIIREIAETYLLNLYTRACTNNSNINYANIFKNKYKNARIKLCLKLFYPIFDYEWEYFNINLSDLFNIICCVVYKKYNKLYEILYNIKIHKSVMPLKTLHILINYKDDIDNTILAINKEDDNICLLKYVVLFILYNYIENIHPHIIQMGFERLIPIIIQKCAEIKSLISGNKKIPNNFKLLFLKKLNNVYDIFTEKDKN